MKCIAHEGTTPRWRAMPLLSKQRTIPGKGLSFLRRGNWKRWRHQIKASHSVIVRAEIDTDLATCPQKAGVLEDAFSSLALSCICSTLGCLKVGCFSPRLHHHTQGEELVLSFGQPVRQSTWIPTGDSVSGTGDCKASALCSKFLWVSLTLSAGTKPLLPLSILSASYFIFLSHALRNLCNRRDLFPLFLGTYFSKRTHVRMLSAPFSSDAPSEADDSSPQPSPSCSSHFPAELLSAFQREHARLC